MHATVQFGPSRLRWVSVVPGRPGEGARVREVLTQLEPGVVACAVSPAHLLALQRGKDAPFPYGLLLDEASRRFRTAGSEDPYGVAFEWAKASRADYETLLPAASRPNWFARRRLRRAVQDIPSVGDPLGFLRAFEDTVAAGTDEAADAEPADACARALSRIVFQEGATRAVAILPETVSDAVIAKLEAMAPPSPRTREPPRETATLEEVDSP